MYGYFEVITPGCNRDLTRGSMSKYDLVTSSTGGYFNDYQAKSFIDLLLSRLHLSPSAAEAAQCLLSITRSALHKHHFSDLALRLCSLPSIFFKSQYSQALE